jgi:hypothetical protein
VITSSVIVWAGHELRVGNTENVKERDNFGNTGVNGRVILK